MTAEQVVDSISEITGTPLALKKVYSGVERKHARVIELPAGRFSGGDKHPLLIFGKPLRVQACDCERGTAPSLTQAMYLYNDESLWNNIAADDGRLKSLVEKTADDRSILDELYLLTLSRFPTDQEVQKSNAYLKSSGGRLKGFQDILWSLLNRQEFLVEH